MKRRIKRGVYRIYKEKHTRSGTREVKRESIRSDLEYYFSIIEHRFIVSDASLLQVLYRNMQYDTCSRMWYCWARVQSDIRTIYSSVRNTTDIYIYIYVHIQPKKSIYYKKRYSTGVGCLPLRATSIGSVVVVMIIIGAWAHTFSSPARLLLHRRMRIPAEITIAYWLFVYVLMYLFLLSSFIFSLEMFFFSFLLFIFIYLFKYFKCENGDSRSRKTYNATIKIYFL